MIAGTAILPLFVTLTAVPRAWAAASGDEARVTRIIRDVKLLPSGAKATPASLNDKVNSDTGVRTGDRSRSELTFVDLTIERLGSNTVFHFNNAGRAVQLDSGSMLLRVPKNSGGAEMQTRAVTVGVTGTTVILETTAAGGNKLIVLEGSARLSLRRYPGESVNVRGGQMEDVPRGATKLPPPVNINLDDVMKKHPLITDFPPLPSRDLIYATMNNPPANEPSGSGPGFVPVLGNIIGPPIGIGIRTGSRGGQRGDKRNPSRTGTGRDGVGNSSPLKDVGTVNSSPTGKKPSRTVPRKRPKTG